MFPGAIKRKHKGEVVVNCQLGCQHPTFQTICVYSSPFKAVDVYKITLEEAVALLELYLVVMIISFSWAIYFLFVSKPLFGKN